MHVSLAKLDLYRYKRLLKRSVAYIADHRADLTRWTSFQDGLRGIKGYRDYRVATK